MLFQNLVCLQSEAGNMSFRSFLFDKTHWVFDERRKMAKKRRSSKSFTVHQ